MIQQVSKTLINTDFRLKQCKRAQKASIRVNHIERKFIQTEWFLSLTGISYDHDSFPCILKNLSRGFRNTSYYLATGKNHIQLWAAPNIEISAQDRQESFYDIELHIYSFFGVSVNQISDSAQTHVLMRDKLFYVGLWIKISDIKC